MTLRLIVALLLISSTVALGRRGEDRGMIDLTDREDLARRRPILIAHRGGVVTPQSPEGSLAAIRLAAEYRYDMVELDLRETSDHEPVLFHDKTLERATGREGRIEDLPLAEALSLSFVGVDEKISSLDQALALCRDLELGVMLDVKSEGSASFFQRMKSLLKGHDFAARNTIVISSRASVREYLREHALLRFVHENKGGWAERLPEVIEGGFWFGQPADLPSDAVRRLQEKGLLVLPAINAFRYFSSVDLRQEKEDAKRLLEAGADGFQIDSRYQHLFGLPQIHSE